MVPGFRGRRPSRPLSRGPRRLNCWGKEGSIERITKGKKEMRPSNLQGSRRTALATATLFEDAGEKKAFRERSLAGNHRGGSGAT